MTQARPSRCLKQGASVAASFAMIGLVVGGASMAQAASGSHPTMEELLRRLEERDALIADLQRRVEALERQIATTADRAPPVSKPSVAAKPAPSVPALASSAKQEPSTQADEAPAVDSGTAQAAPGQFEVDEEAAERALERALVLTGALLLPFGKADIQTSFDYIRSQDDVPSFFSEEEKEVIASQDVRSNIFIGNLLLRFGLPFDSQLEVGIPYRYAEQNVVTVERGVGPEVDFDARAKTEDHDSGFGDLSLGLAKGLLRERNWWPDLIGRVIWDTDSGGGFNELLASLTMAKRQDPLVFTGSAAYATTFEKDGVILGDRLGFSVGALLAASPETSLRVVLNQTFVNELEVDDRTISGSDLVAGTLNFGASSIIGHGKFLDLTTGIGLTDGAPDYSAGLSFSVRFDIPTRF